MVDTFTGNISRWQCNDSVYTCSIITSSTTMAGLMKYQHNTVSHSLWKLGDIFETNQQVAWQLVTAFYSLLPISVVQWVVSCTSPYPPRLCNSSNMESGGWLARLVVQSWRKWPPSHAHAHCPTQSCISANNSPCTSGRPSQCTSTPAVSPSAPGSHDLPGTAKTTAHSASVTIYT